MTRKAGGDAEMSQFFRVFLKDGSEIVVEADTYVGEGQEWVLYSGFGTSSPEERGRFPRSEVNGIALRAKDAAARD
jgi:hypothetical protein